MTWQLMWRNVRAAALNATLQLLVIYRLVESIIMLMKHLCSESNNYFSDNIENITI